MGLAIVLIGCAVTLIVSPLLFSFIYPVAGLVLAIAALVALCWRSRAVLMSRVVNFLACVYLGVATVFALLIFVLFMQGLGEGYSVWLFLLFQLLPQLFWYRRFRSSPLAAFLVVVASASCYTYVLIGIISDFSSPGY